MSIEAIRDRLRRLEKSPLRNTEGAFSVAEMREVVAGTGNAQGVC